MATESKSAPSAVDTPIRCDLGPEDFAEILGVEERELPRECRSLIEAADFRHDVLRGSERDAVILRVLHVLETDLPRSGANRLQRWEEGWGENLSAFIDSGYDPATLIPKYYERVRRVMRLRDEYVIPVDVDFETSFFAVLRAWIAKHFFPDAHHVYEYGCGPAHNLVALAALLPSTELVGLDWATPSQKIITLIAERLGLKVSGVRFDMFNPDPNVRPHAGAVALTIGAMEQLGEKFQPFLQHLIGAPYARYVHVEPITELYRPDSLLDHLGDRYSRRRGYLRGFLSALKELEQSGAIRILHEKKNLGSLYHDGWSTIAWEKR